MEKNSELYSDRQPLFQYNGLLRCFVSRHHRFALLEVKLVEDSLCDSGLAVRTGRE